MEQNSVTQVVLYDAKPADVRHLLLILTETGMYMEVPTGGSVWDIFLAVGYER